LGLVTRSSCVDRQRRERPSSVIRATASGLDGRFESSRGIGRRNGEAARGARVRIVAAAAEEANKEGAAEVGGGGNDDGAGNGGGDGKGGGGGGGGNGGDGNEEEDDREGRLSRDEVSARDQPRPDQNRSRHIHPGWTHDPCSVFFECAVPSRPGLQANKACESAGIKLPNDMAEIAAAEGIRPEAMNAFVELMTKKAWLGWLFAAIPAVRDRALADPAFLFKLGVEVLGDVALSVASEMTGRNEHFWDEAEYFFSDVAATVCLNGAVLTMLSPVVTLGKSHGGGRALVHNKKVGGKLNHFIRLVGGKYPRNLPKHVFQKGNYTTTYRAYAFVSQGFRIGIMSSAVGLAGQGTANLICTIRRKYMSNGYSEKYASTVHPEAPPLLEPAMEWGAFMGTSGNARQQLIAGVERVMRDANAKMPALNLLATLVLRVGNNVWGGEQFATKMREMEDSVWEEYSSKVAEVSTTKSGGKR